MNNKHLIIAFSLAIAGVSQSLASDITWEPSARYRYQSINDDFRSDAIANTIKARLSAKYSDDENIQGLLQVDAVHAFNEGRYNSIAFGESTAPIPDPSGEEINQLWLSYTTQGNWEIIGGRQLINLNNERHVSGNEFWQNDQTFDAINLRYDDQESLSVEYFYLNKAHRIFSDDAKRFLPDSDPRFQSNPQRPLGELGNHKHKSHIVNLSFKPSNFLKIIGYSILIENESAPALSSDTYGARVEGEIKPSDIRYQYAFELATQGSSTNSPLYYRSSYVFADLSAQYKGHRFGIGYEKLGEDNNVTFRTSLGNNHLFLGWTDLLAGVRSNRGLVDTSISYRARINKLRWRLIYHRFSADNTDDTIGDELDIEIAYRYDRNWEFTLIAAKFFSNDGLITFPATTGDVTSISLMAAYRF